MATRGKAEAGTAAAKSPAPEMVAVLRLDALPPLRVPSSLHANAAQEIGPSQADMEHKTAPASPDTALAGSATRKASALRPCPLTAYTHRATAKHGKRELAALGGAAVDLAAGRPSRRLGAGSPVLAPAAAAQPAEDDVVQGDSAPSRPASPPLPTPAAAQEQQQPAAPEATAVSPQRQARRAAALHAAEAIAAQAAGEQEDEGQPEGPQGQAEPALWPQPSFDAARLSPHIMKGRRTVRRRNEELLAGGFGNSPLLAPQSGPPTPEVDKEPDQAPVPTAGVPVLACADAELRALLVARAAAVRDITGAALDRGISVREVLKGGVLANQPVFFQTRHGQLLLTGTITEEGQIACECRACCPGEGRRKVASVSCSEFEEHAGSRERRPGESIYEFCTLVNDEARHSDRHASVCAACGDGGDLICCDGCPTAVHPLCIGMEEVPEGDWFCDACTARGRHPRQSKLPPPQQQPKPRCAAKAQSGGRQAKGGASAASGALPRLAGSVGASGRVHMAAPAQRGVSGARRERNSNKHKRLFLPDEPGGLKDGEPVAYITSQGEELLKGCVRIDPAPNGASGILCACCAGVVSCSQFEAHAGRGSRRAPYDNIFTAAGVSLRKLAQLMPASEPESPGARRAADRGPGEIIADAGMAGGCALCASPDFQRGGFGPRTMIICDQCEREFHIGCLAEAGRAQLTELPEGNWYCSPGCAGIAGRVRAALSAVPQPLPRPDYSWQLLRGKDGTHATTWALKAALEILGESFDPITELRTGADLMGAMVQAAELGDWDYTGMLTALLRHRGKPVCCAVFRIFGAALAEVPLVATRLGARRCGHARVLMAALEHLCTDLGVARLALPAAASTVDTWVGGFGFRPMTEEEAAATRQELRMLIFPGTELLCKPLQPEQPAAAGAGAAAAEQQQPASMAETSSAEGASAKLDAPPLMPVDSAPIARATEPELPNAADDASKEPASAALPQPDQAAHAAPEAPVLLPAPDALTTAAAATTVEPAPSPAKAQQPAEGATAAQQPEPQQQLTAKKRRGRIAAAKEDRAPVPQGRQTRQAAAAAVTAVLLGAPATAEPAEVDAAPAAQPVAAAPVAAAPEEAAAPVAVAKESRKGAKRSRAAARELVALQGGSDVPQKRQRRMDSGSAAAPSSSARRGRLTRQQTAELDAAAAEGGSAGAAHVATAPDQAAAADPPQASAKPQAGPPLPSGKQAGKGRKQRQRRAAELSPAAEAEPGGRGGGQQKQPEAAAQPSREEAAATAAGGDGGGGISSAKQRSKADRGIREMLALAQDAGPRNGDIPLFPFGWEGTRSSRRGPPAAPAQPPEQPQAAPAVQAKGAVQQQQVGKAAAPVQTSKAAKVNPGLNKEEQKQPGGKGSSRGGALRCQSERSKEGAPAAGQQQQKPPTKQAAGARQDRGRPPAGAVGEQEAGKRGKAAHAAAAVAAREKVAKKRQSSGQGAGIVSRARQRQS